jgi:uncharacterized integral membrane protein
LLRKILTAIVVIPIAIIMIAFAVANRHSVTISLDPFSSNDPVASVTLPLFALIFFLLIVGVFIGMAGGAGWRAGSRRNCGNCVRKSPQWRQGRALPRRACNSVRRRPAPSFGPRRLSYPAVRTRQA